MYESKCYRIEMERNGRVFSKTYADASLETIKKAMEGNIKNSPLVKVYHRYGKNVVLEFRG